MRYHIHAVNIGTIVVYGLQWLSVVVALLLEPPTGATHRPLSGAFALLASALLTRLSYTFCRALMIH